MGPAPAVLVLDARQPSTRAAAAPVCSSDASTSCRLSQPMKLIPFICVFASIDTGCYPPSHSPYSICCVCVVRQILISCFICRLTTSVNKQDTPPFFFFLLLSTGTSAPWRVSAVRQAGGEGLKGNRSTSVNRSIGLIAPRLIGKWRILTWSDNGGTVCPSVCLWRN